MEIGKKEVIHSQFYYKDIQDVFEYGEASFGEKAALHFYEDLKLMVRNLETEYLLHPERRHLETKTKIYRNIILGSYLIFIELEPIKLMFYELFTEVVLQKKLKK
jgi:plasmid stabilization system protein ParE